jgi:hypothetical protein
MRALLALTAVGILASLFLPWMIGMEEDRYTVAGWEARPLFTVVIVVICTMQVHLAVVPGLCRDFAGRRCRAGSFELGREPNDYYEVLCWPTGSMCPRRFSSH